MSARLYITENDLRSILGTAGQAYDQAAVSIACESASRGIDAFKGTRYYKTPETRVYSGRSRRDRTLPVDDLVAVTEITLDTDDDGTYEVVLADTEYVLEPANAALDGLPYTQIVLLPRSGRHWPTRMHAIRVEADFGWAETPAQVRNAAALLANRFLTRLRQAPLAVVVQTANDMVAMARLGSIDPDVASMLESLPARRSSHRSLQLT